MIPPLPRYTYYASKYKNLIVCMIINKLQIAFPLFLFSPWSSLFGFSRFAFFCLLLLFCEQDCMADMNSVLGLAVYIDGIYHCLRMREDVSSKFVYVC